MTTHSHGTNGKRVRARVGAASDPNRSDRPDGTTTPAFDRSNGKRAGAHALVREPEVDRLRLDTRGIVPEGEARFLSEGFGGYVRTLRKEAGLSQDRASSLCGLSVSHISKLERGLRRPSVPAVKALARVLAPSGEVEALEQRLAGLAGGSLREGAERKKLQAENRSRRLALVDMEKHIPKIQGLIHRQEHAGIVVSGTLRNVGDLGQKMLDKLRADIANTKEPEGIKGFTPKILKPSLQPLPRGATQAQLRAWLTDQEQDDEDFE